MAAKSSGDPNLRSYLAFVLATSISGWWTLITGAIGLVAWVFIPGDTIPFSKVLLLVLILFVSFCLYIGISVVYRGWALYRNKSDKISVSQIVHHAGDRVFLLSGSHNIRLGFVLEVYRKQESLEVPIGLIEVTHEKEDGSVQASPIWIMPVHMRDIQQGNLSVESLIVHRTLSKNTLLRWIDDRAERKVQELLKRGVEG